MDNQEQPLTKKQRRELKRQEKLENRKRSESKKTVSKIIIWVVVLVAVIGGIYFLSQMNSGTSSSATVDAITDVDQTKGNPDGQIVLIEYSDFQCPACSTYYNMSKQLMDEFSEDIYFAYRHFPLRNIHSNAQLAAQVAEAAGRQGKFWEMHDKLFDNQSNWSDESNPEEIFLTYAKELELNEEEYNIDLESKEVKDKVDNDYTGGVGAKVNSTPSFFLNGEKISNPKTIDDFRETIQKIIDENKDAVTDE